MTVRLCPMSPERYLPWVAETTASFAAQQTSSGAMPEREARDYAEREFDRLLPEGLRTPGHHVWSAFDGDAEVGYLWLGVRTQSDGVDGFVYDVAVAPEHRHRGYGRAVMAAAEDAARTLGVTVVRLNVFGHNVPARRLYEGLGYEVASTMMTRRLDTTTPLVSPDGPEVRLAPMTQAQFDVYRAQAEDSYAGSIAASGMLPAEEARRKSAEDFARLLPQGLDSPDQQFWTAYDGQAEVGMVWLDVSRRSDGLHAFGYDFRVSEELRRHGYGRAVVVAAEALCRDRGVVAVGLNVFGHNRVARRLYEQMGFEVTASLMRKVL